MNNSLKQAHELMSRVEQEVHKRIVGMEDTIELVLVAIFADGHILLEGVPGIGKTYLLNTFAEACDVDFGRVQMTPDLLPRDILGYDFPDNSSGELRFRNGPVFCNFLLADELNRANPKVASALLEAMQEKQVTTESEGTILLPKPFFVFATQNPIEQEGTYELAEAQRDRFLMKAFVKYPTHEQSVRIAKMKSSPSPIGKIMSGEDILSIQKEIEDKVYIDDSLVQKVVRMTELTRPETSEIADSVFLTGASTRAPMALVKAARALAVLRGRDFVLPQDILHLAYPVLCHRVIFKSPDKKRYDKLFRETLADILNKVMGSGAKNG